MTDQVLGFLQHFVQESASLLFFDRVECRSATLTAKQTEKELAILAEPVVIINKEHVLI